MGVRKTETCLIVWSAAGTHPATSIGSTPATIDPPEQLEYTPVFDAAAFYDAGDQGCGEGPLNKIAAIMRKLEPGQALELRATDSTVAVDLPAWCRLTGYKVEEQRGDRYLIRKGR
ncbi:MAG: sulfurtransferase TusA family protein [Anaerolineales bacterium]|nr:MAG: sulfurtransferase TusA family protein [Anaerolineales bacterium]